MMRKIMNIFAAALVMLAAASCEKNEVLPHSPEREVITLKASINNGATKTSLGEKDGDKYPVLWSDGDAIAVIQEDEVYKFNLISVDDNGQSGTFELDNTLQYENSFNVNGEIKAFYPYDGVSLKEGEIKYNVPAVHNFSVSVVTSKGIYYKTSASKTISTSQILKMGDWYLDMNSDNKSYVENGVCLGQGITLLDKNGNKIIWAPVNCGYDENHKYGLLYQWGRKDGQGYYDESKEPIIADETLDNPDANTFYKGWTATAWSDGNNPCPEGWRVPTINELNSLYDNSKIGLSYQSYDMPGLWFYGNTSETQGNNMFFPAAGQLTNNGTSSERGENCYYWSSDTDGEKSEVLIFYKNRGGTESVDAYVQPLERAYGCSVRCVME